MIEGHSVFLLLFCAAVLSLGGAQTETPNYTNVQSDNLTYVSDDGYVETGVNMALLDPNALDGKTNKVYKTVRSFPNATRSCYHLPATVGSKYLLRAAFMYGNYDGLNSPPSFRLYLGVDSWETVTLANATHVVRSELVTQAVASVLYVCLVRTGGGTPFISSLKLRPLPSSLYAPANSSIALTTFRRFGPTRIQRSDYRPALEDNPGSAPVYGITKHRYPADSFDRIWEFDYNSYGSPRSTNDSVTEFLTPTFGTPSAVLQTAVYAPGEIVVSWPGGVESAFFLTLEFADVVPPSSGKRRRLTVQLNDQHWGDVNVTYLSSNVLYSTGALIASRYSFSIRSTNASDEGAVLNSFEVYKVLPLSGFATNADDVSAIMAVKEYYQLKKYWVADPCLPQNSPWDGLTCDNSSTPRIVTLDLSNSKLDGIISGHISKLTALTTLNLSRNNLNGQVPAFLQDLPSLIKIDLSNNNLSGPLPTSLKEKMKDGELMLSIENNPQICQEGQCSQDGKTTHKSRRTVIVISLVISSLLTVVIVVAVIVTIKRRKQDNHQQHQTTMEYKKSGIFTYSEVVAMTNDFEKVIGKGGSGTVYYGHLKDGREVAVKKVAGLVEEGTKEFQVEVHLLMQVHHKHLAPFIGYCDDGKQMVVIYEYMANGNLRQRLSGMFAYSFYTI
ncbi:putative LRR receptor-like serine/threonine-protein kinase [Nymphaea thermarum]|nr:putative LRR receptor-like serine/threonine-protein kinase [Nymphaea thermarum]